ncbi:unnamed protein product, partial [Rotaria sp. Silwood2]
MATQTTES